MTFYNSQSQVDLATLAHKYKTDKQMSLHGYVEPYQLFFESYRNKNIKVLEIGFCQGYSAQMWEEYFPLAELHYLDIDPQCYNYMKNLSTRSHLHMIDQSDQKQLKTFIQNNGNFDIIIDDGGHTMTQQKTSFEILFPHLKKGGIYVIEDLSTSYHKTFGGGGDQKNPTLNDQSTIRFLQSLIEDVNYIGAKTWYGNLDMWYEKIKNSQIKEELGELTYYQENIKSIYFHGIICFIFKR